MPATKKTEEKKDVKITQEETDGIRELQNTYTQITVNMGQISIAMERTKENLDNMETQREELLAQHNTAQEEEKKIVEELTSKYGVGNLDLDTGIFTPNE
jgi:allophanate hydrolase subunit 1